MALTVRLQRPLAFVVRALRVDARSAESHLARLIFAMIFYAVAMALTRISWIPGAPGLRMLSGISWVNFTVILLAATGQSATAFLEERRQGTLGLLVLTGIDDGSLLTGLVVPRMLTSILMLFVQLPFALLAITLGGVTVHQIFAVYIALAAFLVLVSGAGVLVGVIVLRRPFLAGLAALVLAVPFLPAAILGRLHRSIAASSGTFGYAPARLFEPLVEFLPRFSPFERIPGIMTTGFDEPIVSLQVASNVTLGIALMLLATRLLPHCAVALPVSSEEAAPRALTFINARRSRRVWRDAIAWKEFHDVLGGRAVVVGAFVLVPVLGFAASCAFAWGWPTSELAGDCIGVLALTFFGLLLFGAALALFGNEVKQKTLATLLLTPLSIRGIAWSKVFGWGLASLPLVASGLLAVVLSANVRNSVFVAATHHHSWVFAAVLVFMLHALVATSIGKGGSGCLILILALMLLNASRLAAGLFGDWNNEPLIAAIAVSVLAVASVLLERWIGEAVRRAAEGES